ncbi:AAA family ATPase [Crossiella sp. CA-258035]|uniref:HelD family protein n=1 Tax=Crossiella sp. CA-258035 TaxID=2981138 RepID=UPI0024BD3A72|nr:AAA family ATPase [Crossiella sp. CA-258035]WHT23661.1 AAA family ATPase [Crossiella sp. CA-258035]
MLYGRLDGLRARAKNELTKTLRESPGGNLSAGTERDVSAAHYNRQLAQYSAVEAGLCFGRLDFDNGEARHIGLIGIFDEDNEYEPLLMDWRAPAARPFYLATGANPLDVHRRRHIKTRMRKVVDIDDEVLDITAEAKGRQSRHGDGLTGETVLLAALNASRTGRMKDIVQTIQAEQDRIIRADLSGVLVVQGGPGTGKTAVALHRAAYLLYTHRDMLTRRGVLIVGPNQTFLHYIGEVLPSLGETSVLMATLGELYPGVVATGQESPEAAAIKGGLGFLDVLKAAVRDRQEAPEEPIEIMFERQPLVLKPSECRGIVGRGRRSRRLHNLARPLVERELLERLTSKVAGKLGREFLDSGDLADIRAELRAEEEVRAAMDRLWPVLTPEQLLRDLFSDPDRLERAAPGLTEAERKLLLREPDAPWTPADVPLLDEAMELLGVDDRAEKAAERRRQEQRRAYAQGVLDILDLDDAADPEMLMGYNLLSAEQLADRYDEVDTRTAAERAATDRTWTFGHVIVDEAQELSPMAWRLLMRRSPSRSMTLVGDIAQTGDLAGANSWQEVLGPYVRERWKLTQLTVNYRTPREIMDVAAEVLAELPAGLTPPSSVRDSGHTPWSRRVDRGELGKRLAEVVLAELAEVGEGRIGVIVPAAEVAELGEAVLEAVPTAAVGESPELENQVVLMSTRQAKGLEFDAVLVVDPAEILAESPRGANDLYVALTRATQRLGVVHTGELPPALRGLTQVPAS